MTVAVRGGTVVTARGSERADVFIDGERITRVGRVRTAEREIDATGMLVLPGCVDLHTHLAPTATWTPIDDWEHGTAAALASGVTTVLSMAHVPDGVSPLAAAEQWRRDAEGARADHAFHVVVSDPERVVDELPALVRDGYAGLKVFMTSPRFTDQPDEFTALYRAAASRGVVVAVHAEDRLLIERSTAALRLAGRTSVRSFPASRPVEAEVTAVRAALRQAAATGVAMYLVHLSSAAALDELRRAKARGGSRVLGEMRPLYLYLTRERFDRDDGALWVGQPPLREQADVYAAWRALADGTIDAIGTDHVPYTRARKLAADLPFDRIPPGVANLETMLPMLYSEGVRRERISVERLVDLLATTPARIAGLASKGDIQEGKDADLVIFDPHRTRTIRSAEMHSASDYDPYEGWVVTGWPRTVLLRGQVAYDGTLRAPPGTGRFVPRSPLG